MKIAHINERSGTGSIGRLAKELSVSLENSGHESILYFSHGKPLYSKSVRIGSNIDHKFHAFMSRLTGLQGYFEII